MRSRTPSSASSELIAIPVSTSARSRSVAASSPSGQIVRTTPKFARCPPMTPVAQLRQAAKGCIVRKPGLVASRLVAWTPTSSLWRRNRLVWQFRACAVFTSSAASTSQVAPCRHCGKSARTRRLNLATRRIVADGARGVRDLTPIYPGTTKRIGGQDERRHSQSGNTARPARRATPLGSSSSGAASQQAPS